MKRTQRGMSLIGFILVLGVVGVFAYMGMKVIPMYSEFYSVKQSLNGLANEPGVASMDSEHIRSLFFRRMDVNYSENVKPENVKFQRRETGWQMTVNYEVRRPLIANLDVVGNFHAEKELKRNAGDN
ncbi:DUF4845 domain-containing protein [Lysobacter tyrosinilyticus]